MLSTSTPQQRVRMRRLVPLLVLAGGAFAGGLLAASLHEPEERRLAARFADAWAREDYAEMHAMLSPGATRREIVSSQCSGIIFAAAPPLISVTAAAARAYTSPRM